MRNRVDYLRFEQRTQTELTSGQLSESWTPRYHRYGTVTPASAGQPIISDQMQTAADYSVAIDWDKTAATVTAADWRIVWRDTRGTLRTLNVQSVSMVQNGRSGEITFGTTLDR